MRTQRKIITATPTVAKKTASLSPADSGRPTSLRFAERIAVRLRATNDTTARGIPSPGASRITPRQTAIRAITRSSESSRNVRPAAAEAGGAYGLRGTGDLAGAWGWWADL